MKGWIAGPELRDDLPEPSGPVVAVKATSVNAIDLRTAGDLSRHFRDEVVRTAQPQYVAG